VRPRPRDQRGDGREGSEQIGRGDGPGRLRCGAPRRATGEPQRDGERHDQRQPQPGDREVAHQAGSEDERVDEREVPGQRGETQGKAPRRGPAGEPDGEGRGAGAEIQQEPAVIGR
jgi:hypothetical protein